MFSYSKGIMLDYLALDYNLQWILVALAKLRVGHGENCVND